MISQRQIDEAISAAVMGGQFIATRLQSGSPEIIFASGLTNFVNKLLLETPNARLSDVRRALQVYAQSRAKPS